MIVTCPACQTRYLVDEAELGGEAGRRVRCASCGHLWRYSPVEAAIQTAVAEATAEVEAAAHATTPPAPASAYVPTTGPAPPRSQMLRAEPGTETTPRLTVAAVAAPRPPVIELDAATIARALRAGGLGASLLFIVLLVAAIVARDSIMAIYPPAARVYAIFHLGAPAGPGLELTTSIERDENSLVVTGTISNASAQPHPLARLRVILLDGTKGELESRTIAPPVDMLPPGGSTFYRTVFDNPSITVAAADVSFAAE